MREWLKEKRIEAGATMDEMASGLNISTAYYSMIESGERQKKMDITLASKLATIFGMTLSEVVKLEEA